MEYYTFQAGGRAQGVSFWHDRRAKRWVRPRVTTSGERLTPILMTALSGAGDSAVVLLVVIFTWNSLQQWAENRTDRAHSQLTQDT